jgi:hypothetical protein
VLTIQISQIALGDFLIRDGIERICIVTKERSGTC